MLKHAFYLLLPFVTVVRAIELDITSKESICSAAALAANGIMDYTDFSKGIGLLSDPYYWWHAGSAYGGILEDWYICDDDTHEQVLYDSMIAQTGDNFDYIPSNQSTTEGNDDQGFWGMLVMHAAERNFTKPPDGVPDWLALTQAVYNTMWARWDTNYCGGGLRWQIFTWNSGYHYKNTISSGCLFNIAARLARFTGNDTYVDTAETIYDWLVDVNFVVPTADGNSVRVFDGGSIDDNCTDIVELEWTYNFALLLGGAAYLYNFTESDIWFQRVSVLWQGSTVFFNNSIMYERACQRSGNCNNDQRSFRSVLSRFMGLTANLVPELRNEIVPYLEASSEAAALSCTGGTDGHTCGQNWFLGEWDGMWGVGEQMAALETFLSVLVADGPSPLTQKEEGVSEGNYEAGMDSQSTSLDHNPITIETKDRAGSAIITALVLGTMICGAIWMVI